MTCPTSTLSPLATVGSQGAPMCCDMDIFTLAGSGMAIVSLFSVPFLWERKMLLSFINFPLIILYDYSNLNLSSLILILLFILSEQ